MGTWSTSARVSASPGAPFDEAGFRDLAGRVFDRTTNMESSFTNHNLLDGGERWRDRLPDLDVPTLVIHGTDDPILPHEHGVALANEIQGAELLTSSRRDTSCRAGRGASSSPRSWRSPPADRSPVTRIRCRHGPPSTGREVRRRRPRVRARTAELRPRGWWGRSPAELGLRTGAPVLDLAAGTGKLSRALLAAGLDVVAVEPQEAMRERLVAAHRRRARARGRRRGHPLEDGSVQAVTVANGFHWFDQARAVEEIRRVLQAGGGLSDALDRLPLAPPRHGGTNVGTLLLESGRSTPTSMARRGTMRSRRRADGQILGRCGSRPPAASRPEGIVAYVASMSFVAALPEEERTARLAQVAELVEEGETPDSSPCRSWSGLRGWPSGSAWSAGPGSR